MNFRVSARTILHLGSELISSDGVAFYELIKNALDACSPEVRITVTYRLDFTVYDRILREVGEDRDEPDWSPNNVRRSGSDWKTYRKLALDALVEGAPDLEETRAALANAKSRAAFLDALRDANVIEIDDDGEGMDEDVLRDVYLTIGTSYRADQKRAQREAGITRARADGSADVILGEKGLGRLSAMRLGDKLDVYSGVSGAKRWNELHIDWNDFADAADRDLSSVPVAPEPGGEKPSLQSGTLIRISALRAEWSTERLQALAVEQFSRLMDPFADTPRLALEISFNGEAIAIPAFADFLLDHAHGHLKIHFEAGGSDAPRLNGEMAYLLHKRRRALNLSALDLTSLTETDETTLCAIGSFDLEVYWFNRRVLTKIEGIGTLATVRRILAQWAGGVSLYRDGFRVNPYGGPNDDWLDLDRDAFSTSGFKLNRGQIIGRARISQRSNPYLTDQTNREGLKVNPEQQAFVKVLSSTMEIFRQYLVETDKDLRRARRVTAADALARFRAEVNRLDELLPQLEAALKNATEGRSLPKQVGVILDHLRTSANDVDAAASSQEEERGRVMHLASIGLMIEILAHELYRATNAGLKTISQARTAKDTAGTNTSLRVLDAQLRTLQKRLKVLDPLSTNARQTKEEFELVGWVTDIVEGFAGRNRSSRIEISTHVEPPNGRLAITAVKGMFVQILENLLTNSLFWVAQGHRQAVRVGLASEDDETIGSIQVSVDTRLGRITVWDNGPGIPAERREQVFQPFFTTRPQKQGRGLGLYIAREIAEYHGGRLYLGDADDHDTINSVILALGETE
ncbi:HAMP domain-containing sensor histidine kinase [Xanthobacter sp. VNH20]|uniref:HAMP domain-containing sensor histidine kinase n=1 Tax=Xanthobacter TaxID=279 RepID=UPI0032B48D6B